MKRGAIILGLILAAVIVSAAIYQEPWSLNQNGGFKNLTNMDNIQANKYTGNFTVTNSSTIDWVALNNYPVACPDGYFISQLNDSTICSSSSSNLTLKDANITGNLYSTDIYQGSNENLELAYNLNFQSIDNNIIIDSSGQNYHGVIYGSPSYTNNGFNSGGTLAFDGVDDYIKTNRLIVNYSLPYTISFWIKSANQNSSYTEQRSIIGARGDDGSFTYRGAHFQGSSGRVAFAVGNASTTTGNVVVSLKNAFNNNWHNFVGVYNGSTIFIYQDGALIGSQNLAFTPTDPNKNFEIGRDSRSANFYFNGSFDDVRIYNRTLSSAEIKSIYLKRSEISDPYVNKKDMRFNQSGILETNLTIAALLNMTGDTYFGSGTNGYGNFSGNRPLFSKSTRSVTVCDSGCDYTTINAALWETPFFLFHSYTITVQKPYSAWEHVYIPPSIVMSDMSSSDIGSAGLSLHGNCTYPSIDEIAIQSVHILSNIGALHPYVQCFMINGTQDPNNNENASVAIVGSRDPQIQRVNFTGANANYAVLAYSSGASIANIDLGNNDFIGGFLSKHGGYFHTEPCVTCFGANNLTGNYNVIGSVTDNVYVNSAGVPYGINANGATGTNGIAGSDRAPFFDSDTDTMYGVSHVPNGWNVTGQLWTNDTITSYARFYEPISPEGLVLSVTFDQKNLTDTSSTDAAFTRIMNGTIISTTENYDYSSTRGIGHSGAYYFNSTNGRFNTSVDFDTRNSFTYTFWTNATNDDIGPDRTYKAIDKDNDTAPPQYAYIGIRFQRAYFRLGNATLDTSIYQQGPYLNDSQWHMITGVHDTVANTITVYVDGKYVAKNTNVLDIITTGQEVRIGTDYSAGNFYRGILDSPMIFTRALSAEEINRLYEYQVPKLEPANKTTTDAEQKANGDIIPAFNSLWSLGSSVKSWLKAWLVNLDVSGQADINIINNTGNATINNYYAQMWNHTDAGVAFNLNETGLYLPYNTTFGSTTNGFIYVPNGTLQVQEAGKYKVDFALSGSGQANHNYHAAAAINGVQQYTTEQHFRMATATDVQTAAGTGILTLAKYDNITLVLEDSTGTGVVTIYSANLNLLRIGN